MADDYCRAPPLHCLALDAKQVLRHCATACAQPIEFGRLAPHPKVITPRLVRLGRRDRLGVGILGPVRAAGRPGLQVHAIRPSSVAAPRGPPVPK